jgi:hypothetical protein
MTKPTWDVAITCLVTLLGICTAVDVQAQVINSNEDFQLYCSEGAYYYKVQSPDCDRYIQENSNQNVGATQNTNHGAYIQHQEQASLLQYGQQLFADAEDAHADDRYGVALKLFEAASEAYANAGDQENARIANRNAVRLNRVCRNYKKSLISHSINRLFIGTSVLGIINDFQQGRDYRRMCRKK